MPDKPRNLGASVRARLLNLAKERNQPFDLLLTRYVLERFLYRLGTTRHRERFVLKGAMLLTTWIDDRLRPTRDLDLLGLGEASPDALTKEFAEDRTKQSQWEAFTKDLGVKPGSLAEVVDDLAAFMMPYAAEALKRN